MVGDGEEWQGMVRDGKVRNDEGRLGLISDNEE